MSDNPIIRSGDFTITSFSEDFPLDTYERVFFGIDLGNPNPTVTYTLTITLYFYRVRRRLSRITALMRRPRGRKLLRALPITEQITFYDMFLEQNQ